MRKRKRADRAGELHAMLQEAAQNHAFDIAADLKELQKQHGRLNKNMFAKYLAALLEKYTTGEYAAVHEVLLRKCREGDIAALRLYHDLRKDGAGAAGEEVQIIDDL